MEKQVIVPFFISHQGCPHRCIFCDQAAITGSEESIPSSGSIKGKVEAYSTSCGRSTVDVAFYGGSFTMLPIMEQRSLLNATLELKQTGKVGSIRLSTRPDGIDEGISSFLQRMGVDIVELGVQSMDDGVLAASTRGHDSKCVADAIRLLRAVGLQVGIQLMPGLPGDTTEKSLKSLRKVLLLSPDFLRIYPTVVVEGTALADLYRQGRYIPLSLSEAVLLGKIMLHECNVAQVPVIRFGLHPTDDLQKNHVVAGPFHPALRQLVESALMYDLVVAVAKGVSSPVELRCHPSRLSDVVGHKRLNIMRLQQEEQIRVAKVEGDNALGRSELEVSSPEMTRKGDLMQTINYDANGIEGRYGYGPTI